jgi:hypothetical protein
MIYWGLMFRLKDHAKALRKIEQVRQAFGRLIEVSGCERYRKDQGLWDCNVHIRAHAGSAAEVVFDCLVLAARLGTGWYIVGPGEDGSYSVFDGVFNVSQSGRPHVSGLEWGNFSLYRTDNEDLDQPSVV